MSCNSQCLSFGASLALTTLASLVMPEGPARDTLAISTILIACGSLFKFILPTNMTRLLVIHLDDTERIYHGAVEAGLFAGPGAVAYQQLINHAEDLLCQLQVDVSKLRETTLRASWKPWKELWIFFKGHSFHILRCMLAVRALKMKIELLREARLRELNTRGAPSAPSNPTTSSTDTVPVGILNAEDFNGPSLQASRSGGRNSHVQLRHMSSAPCSCGLANCIVAHK